MFTSCILWCRNSCYSKVMLCQKSNYWPNSTPQVTQGSPCTLHHFSSMYIPCNMKIFSNFELMDNCTLNKRPGQGVVHHHYCIFIFGPSDQFQAPINFINSHRSESAQDPFSMQQAEVPHSTKNELEAEWGTFFRNRKRSLIQIHILTQAEESESHFGERGNSLSNTYNQ